MRRPAYRRSRRWPGLAWAAGYVLLGALLVSAGIDAIGDVATVVLLALASAALGYGTGALWALVLPVAFAPIAALDHDLDNALLVAAAVLVVTVLPIACGLGVRRRGERG